MQNLTILASAILEISLRATKFKIGQDADHTPFKGDLLSTCCDWIFDHS